MHIKFRHRGTKTMKKTKLLAVTLLGAVLALAGCGETHTSTSSDAASSANEASSSVETPSSSTETASSSSSTETASSSSSEEAASSSSSEEASSSSEEQSSSSDETGLTKEAIAEIIEKAITAQKTDVYAGVMSDNYGSTKSYEYGTDKYGAFTKITDYNTSYYGHRANGDIYGLQVSSYNGSLSTPWSVDPGLLQGPSAYFNALSNSPTGAYLYGVQGILEYVSGIAATNPNKDFKIAETSTETNFSFSLGTIGTLWGDTALHVWTLGVELSGDAVSVLTIECASYIAITADYEDGTYTINEGAEAENTTRFTFAQSIGEKTATNPYDIETLYFTEINYKDSTGADLGAEYSVGAGSQFKITVDSYLPATADFNIDGITLTHDNTENSYGVSGGYSNGIYTIYAFNQGDYNVTLKTANTTKTFLLHVTAPQPESISYVQGYVKEGDSYSNIDVDTTSSGTVYVGQSLSLSASISPYQATQTYTAEVIGDNASDATLVTEHIYTSEWDEEGKDVYTFTSNVVGTYQVKVSSTVDPEVSKTITITVQAAPELSGLLAKRWTHTVAEPGTGVKIYDDIIFAPNAADATTGTVSIYTYDYDSATGTTVECGYTYDAATRTFALTKDGAAYTAIGLAFSTSFNLVVTTTTGEEAQSTIVHEFAVSSILSGTAWQAEAANEASVTINFDYQGFVDFQIAKIDYDTWEYDYDIYESGITYTVTETEDGYAISLDADALESIADQDQRFDGITSIVLAENFSKVTMVVSFNGIAETLECKYTRG